MLVYNEIYQKTVYLIINRQFSKLMHYHYHIFWK